MYVCGLVGRELPYQRSDWFFPSFFFLVFFFLRSPWVVSVSATELGRGDEAFWLNVSLGGLTRLFGFFSRFGRISQLAFKLRRAVEYTLD